MVLMVSLLAGHAVAAEAQAVSSLSDLWMQVKSGDQVFVTEGNGKETAGVFASVSASALNLTVEGQLREIPAADVREIARRGDSLLNGFLIGAGIGAVVEAAAFADCDETVEECIHPAAAAAIGGAVFGGVGALIDHFIKGRTVVFRVKGTALRFQPGATIQQGRVNAFLVGSLVPAQSSPR
jgi:hypothetical protein